MPCLLENGQLLSPFLWFRELGPLLRKLPRRQGGSVLHGLPPSGWRVPWRTCKNHNRFPSSLKLAGKERLTAVLALLHSVFPDHLSYWEEAERPALDFPCSGFLAGLRSWWASRVSKKPTPWLSSAGRAKGSSFGKEISKHSGEHGPSRANGGTTLLLT